jgi:hypothetical protein
MTRAKKQNGGQFGDAPTEIQSNNAEKTQYPKNLPQNKAMEEETKKAVEESNKATEIGTTNNETKIYQNKIPESNKNKNKKVTFYKVQKIQLTKNNANGRERLNEETRYIGQTANNVYVMTP